MIFKICQKKGFHGNDHGFFVVSSENLEFVGWHSGALPWSISFLVEDWSLSQYLDLVLPSNWWWGKIFGVLHLPSPASYISSVLLSSDWIEKKYNLLKRIYCRNRIECTWKRNTEEYRLEDCWRLPEVLIQLRETLGGFWKDKEKSLKDFFFDFERTFSVCRSQFVK